MKKEKILITVKTYPALSQKHDELVCTAGFREDGTWVRIYPIPFRKLDFSTRYKKYQWVELDLERNFSDPRPESYKPKNLDKMNLGEIIGTGKDRLWLDRKKIVLKKVYTNLTTLIAEAKNKDICTSLAVFKPRRVIDFKVSRYSKESMKEYAQKVRGLKEKAQQLELWQDTSSVLEPFEVVEKIPFKFSYHLEDENGKESTMMIEDWEIIELYRKSLLRHQGDEDKACKDVRKKYFDDFVKTKDLYLFLGTTKVHHFRAPNPFIIIGTFHPKPETQGRLFD